MSLSKLESLPNEILINIIEKYINGVDILVAFTYQLNQRFNALSTQCRLRFDFIECRKDDFRFCIGLLPAYFDNIEELALSEQNTPGQIYAFLSFFPSFSVFTRLRTLYFHFNGEVIDLKIMKSALHSLSNTAIQILSIKAMNIGKEISLSCEMYDIFLLKTLKQFSLIGNSTIIGLELWRSGSSNIEYLTVHGIYCEFQHLRQICTRAPHLKYLDVQFIAAFYHHSYGPEQTNTILISELRTLILSFEERDRTTFDMLAQCLNSMPVLNRLEIKAHRALLDGRSWEMLLETSLPLLTHFSLRTTISRSTEADLHNVLASFQTSFWIAKENFNILITKQEPLDFNRFSIDDRQQLDQDEFNLSAIQWWIAPEHNVNDDLVIVNKITNLSLSGRDNRTSCPYSFHNIQSLAVDHLNTSLLKWVTTYVNCSQIKELTISPSNNEMEPLSSLLVCTTNIRLLRISYDLLMTHQNAYMKNDNCIKYIDISVSKHMFNEEDIILIARLFPYLEHIKINTSSLYNVPILKTHLSHLRSLTFKIVIGSTSSNTTYSIKIWENNLRRETQFLYQRDKDSITIWIDQGALEESYWQAFAEKSLESILLPAKVWV